MDVYLSDLRNEKTTTSKFSIAYRKILKLQTDNAPTHAITLSGRRRYFTSVKTRPPALHRCKNTARLAAVIYAPNTSNRPIRTRILQGERWSESEWLPLVALRREKITAVVT